MQVNIIISSRIIILVILLGVGIFLLNNSLVSAATSEIPSWLKTTAKYWSQDSITDDEFVNAIQWLINENIITIPQQGGNTTLVEGESAYGIFSDTRCESGYQYVKMTGIYTNGNKAYSVLSIRMAVLDANGSVLATGSGLLTNVEPKTSKFFDAIAIFSGDKFDSCKVEVSSALPKGRLLQNNNARPIIIEIIKEKEVIKNEETIPKTTDKIPDKTSTSNKTAGSINKIQSGLVISDPLDNSILNKAQFEKSSNFWILGGSAQDLKAPYDYFMDADGIHIGVRSPKSGTYIGSFAMMPPTEGTLFHSSITSQQKTIPVGYLQNGLFVRGSEGPNNYLTCIAITNKDGTSWSVTYSYEDSNGASHFDVLFEDYTNSNLTRNCTIVTDGYKTLRVFLDESEVYNNSVMNMSMKSPLMSSLSTQSSNAGTTLYGVFSDFYITLGTNIQVNNLPPSADKVVLMDLSNKEIASGNVEKGTGIVDVGKFNLPLIATIKVLDEGKPIASTSEPVNIFGGDIYETSFIN